MDTMPTRAADSLSAAQLALRAGTTEDRIHRFVVLGIVEPEDESFRPAETSSGSG